MLKQVINLTEKFFQELFPNNAEIINILPNNEGWELIAEVVTDDEYTRKRARNDLISVFKVQVNKSLEVVSYVREEIRERGKSVDKIEN